jgi:hypothetical protein
MTWSPTRTRLRRSSNRLARHEAELPLQRQAVDLVDHAVDIVGQLVALGADALVERYEFRSTSRYLHLGCDRKTP